MGWRERCTPHGAHTFEATTFSPFVGALSVHPIVSHSTTGRDSASSVHLANCQVD